MAWTEVLRQDITTESSDIRMGPSKKWVLLTLKGPKGRKFVIDSSHEPILLYRFPRSLVDVIQTTGPTKFVASLPYGVLKLRLYVHTDPPAIAPTARITVPNQLLPTPTPSPWPPPEERLFRPQFVFYAHIAKRRSSKPIFT